MPTTPNTPDTPGTSNAPHNGHPRSGEPRNGKRKKALAVAVTAAVTGVLIAGAGIAEAGSEGSSGGGDHGKRAHRSAPKGDGAKRLCKRASKIDKRIERALDRLRAGEARRGSIARLEKRVANAEKAGHSEIKTFLNHRLTFRRSLVSTLQQRRKDLKEVREWCAANDNGKQADVGKSEGNGSDGSAS
ncbi:hypothetical protein [Streptomyces sp. NPDC051776]|uniref:hypothetical protein n=1 Tax=Streptomyces sp. NPDC051776 TaxID=3155414 RepID=UPI00344257EF